MAFDEHKIRQTCGAEYAWIPLELSRAGELAIIGESAG
jgi:hypothetical protein